jgi:hypothetical protein
MASLALIVSVLFLAVLLFGPIVILLKKINILPEFIIKILGIFCIFAGVWWFTITIFPIRFIGLIPAYCGYLVIRSKDQDA